MIKLIDILTEIKINEPGGIRPISMDKLKEALIEDMRQTAEEL